jgi:outer membrane protein TolC
MKKLHILLIAFVLGTFFAELTAQTLTLDECVNKALEYNKSLSSAKLKLDQTRFDMKSYKANFYPQFNLMALDFYTTAKGDFTIEGGHLPIYNYVEEAGTFVPNVTKNADGSYTLNQYADFPSQTMKWKLKNMFVGSISVMEPLYAGGKISTAYEMSKLGVNMATENIRLTESEVIVKTHEAYYQAVKAKELGEVARSYKTLLDELKKNVEGAFRHGMSTRNDIMKVQVKQNEAELSIQKADNGYQLAKMNLCHIIGLPLNSEVEVGQTDPFANVSIPMDMGVRPEHAILDNKTELARQQVKLTKSDYLPNVAVGATYSYANGGELAGKKLINNGSASVGVVVKMPLDLFGGGTNKVRSAKAAYQIAQMEQQDFDEQMQLEWAQCKNLFDEAQTEVRLCQTALEQAAENMRLSKQQYEVGFEPLSDYLETQASWQQCSANLVNARCQMQLAQVRLLKAAGNLR